MNRLDDQKATRRGLVAGLLAAAAAAPVGAQNGARAPAPTPAEQSRLRLRDRRTPNVPLVDQDGRTLNFYDDVMKDRRVLVNVMYTVCSNVCTPATRHLLEARRLLGDDARDLHFVSLSLTPLEDTPQALREYKKVHGIDASWTFLTGKLEHMERVQRALGFLGNRDTDDLLSHSAMARLCDERNLRWSHVNTLLSPKSIARMIRFEMV